MYDHFTSVNFTNVVLSMCYTYSVLHTGSVPDLFNMCVMGWQLTVFPMESCYPH